MMITIEWFGVATFRLRIDDLVVFLDAYMDRVPSAPPVGLRSEDVDRADFVLVGHSHFDHLHGAQHIAKNTGATIIGSHETARVMREQGVAKEQLRTAQGGEHLRLADGVLVRVFPSLHACTWSAGTIDFDEERHGDLGLTEDERSSKGGGLMDAIRHAIAEGDERGIAIRDHLATAAGSFHSGGALIYLIETPAGTIFYQDTSGCWSGVLGGLRADVAILAAAGRGNLDGEPFQGSLAQFVAQEATAIQPRVVVVAHHDDWMPPVTRDGDLSPVRRELSRALPQARLLELEYNTARPLLGGQR